MPLSGVLNVSDFNVEVSRGISGYTGVNKFGKNSDVDIATSPEDIWEAPTALWVAPTQARVHQIASTSTDDDGAPLGTGAQTIEVIALDANWDLIPETYTLNGTTNVPTTAYQRILSMKVLTAGSGGSNAGVITATADVDGTVTAQIAIGNNKTQMAIYTIPNTKTGHMKSVFASIMNGTVTIVDMQLWMRDAENGGVWTLEHEFNVVRNAAGTFEHPFEPNLKIPSKYDVRLTALLTSVDNAVVSGGFNLVTINETE